MKKSLSEVERDLAHLAPRSGKWWRAAQKETGKTMSELLDEIGDEKQSNNENESGSNNDNYETNIDEIIQKITGK